MKLLDLLKMALANQFQRPIRTLLNLIGITLGTVVFIMTSAGGAGVRDAFVVFFNQSELARKVQVRSDYRTDYSQLDESLWKVTDSVEPERKERLEKTLKQYHGSRLNMTGRSYQPIDLAALQELKQIPNVSKVVPSMNVQFGLRHNQFDHILNGGAVSTLASDFEDRILVGELPGETKSAILLHEVVACEMGYRSMEELQSLVGQTVALRFRGESGSRVYLDLGEESSIEESLKQQLLANSAIQKLIQNAGADLLTDQQKVLLQAAFPGSNAEADNEPPIEFNEDFQVTGIYYDGDKNSVFDLFRQLKVIPYNRALFDQQTAETLHKRMNGEKTQFYATTLVAESYQNLEDIEERVKELGLSAFSARHIFEDVDNDIENVCRIVNYVAIGILALTAIGISNTLIISVLERTPEFGIMKALGANNHHILLLMLFEGFVLAMFGSVLAIFVSFGAAAIGDQFLKSYIEGRINDTFSSGLFSISWFSVARACSLAIAVCCIASLLPAWRAARLDPVVAMRQS